MAARFLELLEEASMPVMEVLIITVLGAFMATGYCNLLSADARKHMNKIVFVVFSPALVFVSLAKTVTLEDIISWWFMPINIGLTFLLGGILGWVVVKLLKPEPHVAGLVIACCSAGNLGNLPLIIVPAICMEDGGPFGDIDTCKSLGLSYVSFSMALGGFYIWTHTYQVTTLCIHHQMSIKHKHRKKLWQSKINPTKIWRLLRNPTSNQQTNKIKTRKLTFFSQQRALMMMKIQNTKLYS